LQDEFVEEDASFKPMEQDDLHMTILFLGVRLRRRDKEKMDKINEIILEYLADTDLTPWFKNPRLMRFPPGKNNLVVIEYEIDKETERFVKGLRKKLWCVPECFMKHVIWLKRKSIEERQVTQKNYKKFLTNG